MRPLDGVRILDFTHVLAGPFCTRLMADMGADVVKVNSRTRVQINAPAGPYFTLWNRNKRTVALDMSREEARKIAYELASKADVVIDNFSMGVLDRWGIGYDEISQHNHKVVYVQMSGMGGDGPWSNFVTYAPTIHALAGFTYTTGVPGRQDIGLGFSYNDHQAGLHAAVAILSALESRRRTGKGQKIDISQFEVAVNLLGPTLMDWFANGIEAQPCANDMPHDRIAPHGCYRCAAPDTGEVLAERWIAIACMNDDQWRSLQGVLGSPSWAMDADFQSGEGRYQRRRFIDAKLAEWTASQNSAELMTELQNAGVPAGVVQDGVDLMERDPQLQAREFIQEIEEPHPSMKRTYADKLPIEFERTPCDVYKRARTLGEDNVAILSDWLGIEEEAVRKGEEEGYLT